MKRNEVKGKGKKRREEEERSRGERKKKKKIIKTEEEEDKQTSQEKIDEEEKRTLSLSPSVSALWLSPLARNDIIHKQEDFGEERK